MSSQIADDALSLLFSFLSLHELAVASRSSRSCLRASKLDRLWKAQTISVFEQQSRLHSTSWRKTYLLLAGFRSLERRSRVAWQTADAVSKVFTLAALTSGLYFLRGNTWTHSTAALLAGRAVEHEPWENQEGVWRFVFPRQDSSGSARANSNTPWRATLIRELDVDRDGRARFETRVNYSEQMLSDLPAVVGSPDYEVDSYQLARGAHASM